MHSREVKLAAYASKIAREDPILARVRRESDKHRKTHGCDVHPSDPVTGRMLDVLVRATRARRVLEVGCGLGYSAIWLARAVPLGGRVDTIERDPLHSKLALRNLKSARVHNRVRVLRGDAVSVLSKLKGPYDFIFEDATFGERPRHYGDLIRILRIGGLIQFANWFPLEYAVLGGRYLAEWKRQFPPGNAPEKTRRFVEDVAQDPKLSVLLIPHVWKGLATKLEN